MRSWRIPPLVIATAVVLVATGCTGKGGTTTHDDEASEPAASEPQEATVVAVDYSYPEAPAQLASGVIDVRFENRGTVGHELAFAGIGDASIQRWVEDLGGNALSAFPVPDYLDQVATPPFVSVEARGTAMATMTLTPGRYVMFCNVRDVTEGLEEAPHYKLGMVRELMVVAGDPEPTLPEADGTIVAGDDGFEVDLEAGDRSVNFMNEGPDQIHLTTIEAFPRGMDAAEAERAYGAKLASGKWPKGFPGLEGFGFSGIFSAGRGARLEFEEDTFQSGRVFVLACFLPDREGGKPHVVAYDEYALVTIE